GSGASPEWPGSRASATSRTSRRPRADSCASGCNTIGGRGAYTRPDGTRPPHRFSRFRPTVSRNMKSPQAIASTQRALLVGGAWRGAPGAPGMAGGAPERESLGELVELARSAGADIAGTVFQLRDKADPASLVGRGKLDEIRAEAYAKGAPLIIFDSDLS